MRGIVRFRFSIEFLVSELPSLDLSFAWFSLYQDKENEDLP